MGVLQEEEEKQNQEETKKSIQDNPVLPFTLEEEFKVIDFIVRIENFSSKRFIFINNGFPQYRTLTMENAAGTKLTGKLQYDPVMEGRMFDLALKFTQLNIDHFFDEIKYLSSDAKMEILKTHFHANMLTCCSVICFAMLENNLQGWNLQPLALGCVNVGALKLADQERFTSPWALDYADEVKFSETVARVAEVLGADMKLQALYHMLVMLSPYDTQV